ncbi:hypothetical protein Aduo_019288 [Ancylostoma duodenale]
MQYSAGRPVHAVRFGNHLMYPNGHLGERQQRDDDYSELERVQVENKLLKRRLSQRYGRARGSTGSRIVVAEVIGDDTSDDDVDDSLLLLRENSTLHGLRDLLLSTTCKLRFIWVVILVLAVLLTSHGVWQIMLEFKLRRVVVSYFIQEANTLALPDIVICPFNRFNRSFLEQWNVSAGLAQYLELSYPSPVIHTFQTRMYEETVNNLDAHEYELEMLLDRIGNMSYTSFLKAASLGCEAFFKDDSRCKNLTEIMTSAGKCFRLMGFDQTGDGFGYGERIVINLPQHLYNPGANQMLNDGIVVKLAERGKGIDNDLTFIPSGVHAIMPLSATQYEFMNDPPRYECEEDSDGTYSRVWCFEFCLTQKAEDMCNCSLAAATKPRKPDICTTKQFFHCFIAHLFPENSSSIVENCKSKCKPPCSYWQYQKSVSYATFPGQVAKYFVANQSEWEELKSTIVLEVYFTDLDYTVIKHVVAMPLQSVIAQIGELRAGKVSIGKVLKLDKFSIGGLDEFFTDV